MIKYVEEAMKDNIHHTEWLDTETRANALKKLSMVSNLIGHPEHVEPLEVPMKEDAFLSNQLSLSKIAYTKSLAKIGKPVDRTEWNLAASDATAEYLPERNQMVVPTGILQKPFFDLAFPTAENFGAIGTIIGHELTHGFDSDGRRYDGGGNLEDWWTVPASQEFDARAKCMMAQYSSFAVVGEAGDVIAHVDGNTTIGENIADSGGLKLAYYAYHAFVNDHLQARRLQQQQQQQTPTKNFCGEESSSSVITSANGGAKHTDHPGATLAPHNKNNGKSSTPAGGISHSQTSFRASEKGETSFPASEKGGNHRQDTPVPSHDRIKGQNTPLPNKTIPLSPMPTTRKVVNGTGNGNASSSIAFPTTKPMTKPTSMPMAGGSKDDKLFFISFAQMWCFKARDAAVKTLIATDVHTPDMWRVNGAVMNSKEFAETFQCAANKPMNPTKKCIVW